MTLGRLAATAATILTLLTVLIASTFEEDRETQGVATPAPVLSVNVTRAMRSVLPIRVPAAGHVEAWQEASIGTEANGLRLIDVRVNIGDTIERGQVLALFDTDTIGAELAEAQAAVDQAEAEAMEAEVNARRAKDLEASGALSAQQIDQYVAAAKTARARLDAVRAVALRNRIRLAQTRVLAPGDGIITSRAATVGAVVASGQELFRMIRDGRLEWRAEVVASDIEKVSPGQRAWIVIPGAAPIAGTVRMIAPVIDARTHNGLVYVDLPPDRTLRAGAFARGHLDVGEGPSLTVPRSAVLLRDGFHYVMRVRPDSTVAMTKVRIGRDVGERIEIVAGLTASETIIASGLGFLSDGDTVRVVAPRATGAGATRGDAP